ncbi:Tetratricopeptide-like helical [Cordyceps fumosorosea ARSEF 2679]|uniref:Tetratricopeptide-like helical n=1 Tax=Cordyceps fumosorosea (strain ARSEF 2679) TaxID=1081104 RepID=A0A168D661_CORFA|nr:Tetratricopeptide-like helical [Cordyceps fumosorosea ARSEF 2679]OAA72220.1 Tetratricopeptide-like helical [Cordyceps fumosorosea ARSEF 2679]
MDMNGQNGRRSLENHGYPGSYGPPPDNRARQPPPRGQSRGYQPPGQQGYGTPMNARQPPPREQFRQYHDNRPQDPGYGDHRGTPNPPAPGRGYGSFNDVPNPQQRDPRYGDYDEATNPRQGPPAAGFGPPGRSMTLPFRDASRQNQAPHQRAETMPYNGPAGRVVPQRPATTTGTRPPPQRIYPQQQNPASNAPYGIGYEAGPSNSSAVSVTDVYDDYYDPQHGEQGQVAGDVHRAAPSYQPARSSYDQPRAPQPEQPQRGAHHVPQLTHAKSMAEMREPQSAVFEMAGDIPSMPPMPTHGGFEQASKQSHSEGNNHGYEDRNDQGYDQRDDQSYQQRNGQGYEERNSRGYDQNDQAYNRNNKGYGQGYDPGYDQGYDQGHNQSYDQAYNHGYGQAIPYENGPLRGPSAPPASNRGPYPPESGFQAGAQTMSSMSSHPTPVRPGQMPNSIVNRSIKPPPVRHYDGIPRQTQQQLMQQDMRQQDRHHGLPIPSSASLDMAQGEGSKAPVTMQELEQLRLIIRTNPADQESALRLARRLIEASDALVLHIQDPRARAKAKDRYLMDAHKILKKLASHQNSEAMFTLADGLGKGLITGEPDTKEAFTMYQSAAKLGHASAAYRTAVCCEIGHEEGGGTRRDPLKAMQWYKRAATLGDPPAMYKLGMVMLKGLLGQSKNPREAVGWLKRAAERADKDNPHALHELGLLYESAQPNDLLIRDERYAMTLFQKAAELGYKFSQFRLGCTYEYGLLGCPVDPRQSIVWYSKAAMQEEHQSELALSGWYLTGSEGVIVQSDTEAYLWARKAATAGMAKAEFAMGYFTEVGIGIPPNLEDAKRWYWRAAAQDFPKARERLEELKRVGKTGAPRARERISRSRIEKQEGDCTIM